MAETQILRWKSSRLSPPYKESDAGQTLDVEPEIESGLATTRGDRPTTRGLAATVNLELHEIRKVYKTRGGGGCHRPSWGEQHYRSGEFVTLIGPSGYGRTTLLGIVSDLTVPTSGPVSVDGQVFGPEERAARGRHGVPEVGAPPPGGRLWRTSSL